jgi:hypothetical protein
MEARIFLPDFLSLVCVFVQSWIFVSEDISIGKGTEVHDAIVYPHPPHCECSCFCRNRQSWKPGIELSLGSDLRQPDHIRGQVSKTMLSEQLILTITIATQMKVDWDISPVTMEQHLLWERCFPRAHQHQAEESPGIAGYQTTLARCSTITRSPAQSVTTTRYTATLHPSMDRFQTSFTK